MNSVPRDYVPELLPLTVRQLLYPRYFYDFISEDSKSFDADPTLVLAIMREESRFNPRAKSEAAARGLLQFIITTARQIGRDVGLLDVDPEDLYDPRVIIRLGAKYVSTLSKQFGERPLQRRRLLQRRPQTNRPLVPPRARPRRRLLPLRHQLRRDQAVRAQGDEQLQALRGDLRQRRAERRDSAGAIALAAK